ncbi:hypothetical protein [Chlorobium phaeobacteroides]|nr:hypothetical protein [Chlorobium phaeobacteroides]
MGNVAIAPLGSKTDFTGIARKSIAMTAPDHPSFDRERLRE